jgi:crossover junction endodeoxyribonuclease RuvC
MRILGIDPGLAIVGYGVIREENGEIKPIQYGHISTHKSLSVSSRLKQIYLGMNEIIEKYEPDVLAIEKLYFNTNTTTAFAVSQARGVILLAAEMANLEVFEYTPLQVKQSIVGYGQAEKKQIQMMVRVLLNLKEYPKPDDVADALGVAITHAHMGQLGNRRKEWS